MFEVNLPSESDAVKVEDNVNRIYGTRLIADFHSSQNDLVKKTSESITCLGVLLNDLRKLLVPIHQIVVLEVMQKMFVPVFEG